MLKSFIHNSRVVFDDLTSFLYTVNIQYGYDVKIVAVLKLIRAYRGLRCVGSWIASPWPCGYALFVKSCCTGWGNRWHIDVLAYILVVKLWVLVPSWWSFSYGCWKQNIYIYIYVLLAQVVKGRNACGPSWEVCGPNLHQSHWQTMYIYPPVPSICRFCWTSQSLKMTALRCFEASGNLSSMTQCHLSVDLDSSTTCVETLYPTRYKPSRAPVFGGANAP